MAFLPGALGSKVSALGNRELKPSWKLTWYKRVKGCVAPVLSKCFRFLIRLSAGDKLYTVNKVSMRTAAVH